MRELLSFDFLESCWNAFSTFPRNEPVSDTMLQQPVCTQVAPVGRWLITAVRCTPTDRFRIIADAYRIRIQGVRREIRNDRFVG